MPHLNGIDFERTPDADLQPLHKVAPNAVGRKRCGADTLRLEVLL